MENIDKYYKERLEDYVESPAYNTWDKIADQIGHDRKRKAIILVWRIAAGVALLISLSVLLHNSQKQTISELAVKKVSEQQSISEITLSDNHYENYEVGGKIDTNSNSNGTPALSVLKTHADKASVSEIEIRIAKNDIIESNEIENIAEPEVSFNEYAHTNEQINFLIPIECNSLEITEPVMSQSLMTKNIQENQFTPSYTIEQLLAMNEEEPEEKSKKNKWLLGGQFAPQYAYRNIVSDKYTDYVMAQINAKESPLITYTGGLNVTLSPNKRLSVQSGIYYSKFGQEQNELIQMPLAANFNGPGDPDNMYSQPPESFPAVVYIGNSTGKIMVYNEQYQNAGRSPATNVYFTDQQGLKESNIISTTKPLNSVNQYFEYLEVPVNLKYKVIDRKFDFSLIGGLSTNFLVSTGINLNYSDNSNKNISRSSTDFNQVNYAGSVGFGVEYPLIRNFLISVEPKFKYYLNSIDKEPSGNVYPFAFGIYTGISYVF